MRGRWPCTLWGTPGAVSHLRSTARARGSSSGLGSNRHSLRTITGELPRHTERYAQTLDSGPVDSKEVLKAVAELQAVREAGRATAGQSRAPGALRGKQSPDGRLTVRIGTPWEYYSPSLWEGLPMPGRRQS